MEPQADITRLLAAYGNGDREALDRLMPLLYEHLRRLAHARLHGERAGHSLNTTGLVHEAYLKFVGINRVQWKSRVHFLAVASTVMRRLLVNYARQRRALKRGGGAPPAAPQEALLIPDAHVEDLLELDDVLSRFAGAYPRQALVVQHHYFGGLSNEETAEVLGISRATLERDLRFARAWLARAWDAQHG